MDPIRIIQGELGEANENITQVVHIFPEGPEKWNWLNARLVEFTSMGKVLIFVTQKTNSAELSKNLTEKGVKVGLLHGDMHQDDRNKIINEFKKTDMSILVATDVAARGLDIPAIKTVINYDVARDIDTHTHRIGRTGRAGEKGYAYTLITKNDKEFAPHLVRNLESSNQEVPSYLLELANQVPWFKGQRKKEEGSNRKQNIGGKGLGYKERPSLGAKGSTTSYNSTQGSSGLQTDRAAALKQAFTNQFKSHFVSASNETAYKPTSAAVPSSVSKREAKDADGKKQKKSRWADDN